MGSCPASRIWCSGNTTPLFLYTGTFGMGIIVVILFGRNPMRNLAGKNHEQQKNDRKVIAKQRAQGYRICIFWECLTRDQDLFP
jgi:hypothetical protein